MKLVPIKGADHKIKIRRRTKRRIRITRKRLQGDVFKNTDSMKISTTCAKNFHLATELLIFLIGWNLFCASLELSTAPKSAK